MPQSLSNILIHLTFSTKHREPLLDPQIRDEVFRYLAGVLKEMDCPPLIVGGYLDHIHVLFAQSRTTTVAKVVETIKSSSSRWLKTKGEKYKAFAWQAGYGAFSVSESNAETVTRYIAGQDRHHAKTTFQEELRRLLEKHRVAFDERYVWD
jgi:REP element-mobilizing transposase RayT